MPPRFQNEKSTTLVVGGIGSIALLYWMRRLYSKATPPVDCSSKTVLVIGGGIGGLTAIAGLHKYNTSVKIILVEPKDHVEIYWATYRSPFEQWVREASLIPLKDFCQQHSVTHIRAQVTKLTKESAVLDTATAKDGEVLSFDVCVVATGAGSHWPGMGRGPPPSPSLGTRSQRLDSLQAEGKSILQANHVVIIGGGLIGTELAGDAAAYSQKAGSATKVTLIHSGPQLCPIMSKPAAAQVQKQLESLGVTVLLNEKAKPDDTNKNKLILSNTDTTINDADMIIWTIGFLPLNGLLKESIPESLDERSWIQTDDYFRIEGSDGRLFAIGDCTTTLPNAGNQVMRNINVLGNNIHVTLTHKDVDTASLKKVCHGLDAYCNTTGPDQGVFYCPLFWTRRVLPWVKNSTMFFMSPKDMLGLGS